MLFAEQIFYHLTKSLRDRLAERRLFRLGMAEVWKHVVGGLIKFLHYYEDGRFCHSASFNLAE